MHRYLLIVPALALTACVGACTNEPLPTPGSLELPNPEQVMIPSPGTLPDAQLCAYDAKITAAAEEWREYVDRWAEVLGYEPLGENKKLNAMLDESEEVAKILKARKVLCAVDAPEGS